MVDAKRTRVAVLGTLAEFHREPIPYDLPALLDLVTDINPDLLCLDMTLEQWRSQDFAGLPPEYQAALLPLAHQTDIVVAPIAGSQHPPKAEAPGWRGRLIDWLRQGITAIQRAAPGPDAINQGWRHDWANHLYGLTLKIAGKDVEKAWGDHAGQLTQATLEVAQRNPDSRVLVVVNVQHCHIIRARLRQYNDLEVTTYAEL